ncbi:MAG: hypothetical protein JO110_30085 [Acetobacteraceae bacterium]|nr:hypothetical protein [Acetobacteraceae bacterium]
MSLLALVIALPWSLVVAIWAACTIALLPMMAIAASRIPAERDLGSEMAKAIDMTSGGSHIPLSIG